DEKQRSVSLTESGNEKIEKMLEAAGLLKGSSLYDIENVTVVHHVNQALKAHTLFQRDRDYIVKGGQVVIIDEFTGRMMPGRRYSEGLHQALEAKEKVHIQPENQTLASITFQNYSRLYEKLAGMTGTAATEADDLPDLLPPLRVAGRQDGYGRDRGRRVHGHLRARRGRDPDELAVSPSRRGRRVLPNRQREVGRDQPRGRGGAEARPAGAGRHR